MGKHTPECSVIIPVCNKWELTRDCLLSLREHSVTHDLEVIVVDNGSSDATALELAPLGKNLFNERFVPIVFPENRNFGPACNAGAKMATGSLLFFLNNDTIMTPEWFPPLREAICNNDSFGAVGPLLLYANNSVQHLGVTFGRVGSSHLYHGFPADHPVVAKKRNLQAITGAALMIRSDLFADCGGFFEGYRNGYEDLDLCLQLQRRGKKTCCISESRIFHLESQTPGRKDGDEHNSILFTERCGSEVFIDVHHHALRDGFSVFISDLLTIEFRLQEKDEHAITKEASELVEIGEWLSLCGKHPLWLRGREILAHSLEQANLRVDAILFRLELVDIEPMRSRYLDLSRLMPFAAEGADWPKKAKKNLDLIAQIQSDKRYATKIIQGSRQHFRQGGDPFLEQAFIEKLKELFPQT